MSISQQQLELARLKAQLQNMPLDAAGRLQALAQYQHLTTALGGQREAIRHFPKRSF